MHRRQHAAHHLDRGGGHVNGRRTTDDGRRRCRRSSVVRRPLSESSAPLPPRGGGRRARTSAPRRCARGGARLAGRLRAGFAAADLHVGDDAAWRIEQPGFDQRHQRQVGGGGVAAHAAGVSRALQFDRASIRAGHIRTAPPIAGRDARCRTIVRRRARSRRRKSALRSTMRVGQAGPALDLRRRFAVRQAQEERHRSSSRRRAGRIAGCRRARCAGWGARRAHIRPCASAT